MSTVTPPPPPPPPIAQTAAQPTAVVSNPPASLTSVAAGTRIDAIIVATTPDGRVEVESRLGRFLIQPNISLPKEGKIQLQVQILARQIFLAITSINGKKPLATLHKQHLNAQPGSLVGKTPNTAFGLPGTVSASLSPLNANNSGVQMIAVGSTLTATVLKPTRMVNSSATNTTTQVKKGSTLALNGQGSHVSGTKVAAAYGKPMASQTGPTLTSSGKALGVKVLAISFPKEGINSSTPALSQSTSAGLPNSQLVPGLHLRGHVYSTSTSNSILVQTQAGPIALNAPHTLPNGAYIHLEILTHLSSLNDDLHKQITTSTLSRFLLQARCWPALDEAIELLRDNNSQAALQLISTALPRPDNALAANIVRFILGIRSGELSNLILDPSLRLLMQDKPDLLRRLRDDFRVLGRMSEETVSGDWRALPIPVANGQEIQQIQLLTRRIPSGETDEENRAGPGIRFIIDVDLTKMGHIQLDGLVDEGGKHFDLVIRSEQDLLGSIQNDIRNIFAEAQKVTGTKGWLRFQAAPPKFIDIFENDSNRQLGLLV